MKKSLLLVMAAATTLSAMAQSSLRTQILPDFYTMSVTRDGSKVISSIEDVIVYEVQTGDHRKYEGWTLGNGNCVSYDGSVIVGSDYDGWPIIVKDGVEIDTDIIFNTYGTTYLNAVSADGRHVVGICLAPEGSASMYMPIYFSLGEDGTIGDIIELPHPDTDFLGTSPQYCSATWISDDATKILGQVLDDSGMAFYPILYSRDADGEWSYSLPTEKYLNPDHLPLPVYPADITVPYPQMEDYMSPAAYEAYQKAIELFYEAMSVPYPQYANYMTDEQYQAYDAAESEYWSQYYSLAMPTEDDFMTEEELQAYDQAFLEWREGGFVGAAPQYEDFMTDAEKAEYLAAMEKYEADLEALVKPDPFDYMDADKKAAYETALAAYNEAQESAVYPDPADYLTQAQAEAYDKAAEIYNEDALRFNNELADYFQKKEAITDSSLLMVQNGMTLASDASTAAFYANKTREVDTPWGTDIEDYNPTYLFDFATEELKEISCPVEGAYPAPTQILPDGAIVGSTPVDTWTNTNSETYVCMPGADTFTPLVEYLEQVSPDAAEWMKENFYKNIPIDYDDYFMPIYGERQLTGHARFSDNRHVIAGGVLAYIYSEDFTYQTYVLSGVSTSVGNPVANTIGSLKALANGRLLINGCLTDLAVYNIAGVEVFSTAVAKGTVNTGLANGLYIVRYTDEAGQTTSRKIKF